MEYLVYFREIFIKNFNVSINAIENIREALKIYNRLLHSCNSAELNRKTIKCLKDI